MFNGVRYAQDSWFNGTLNPTLIQNTLFLVADILPESDAFFRIIFCSRLYTYRFNFYVWSVVKQVGTYIGVLTGNNLFIILSVRGLWLNVTWLEMRCHLRYLNITDLRWTSSYLHAEIPYLCSETANTIQHSCAKMYIYYNKRQIRKVICVCDK